MLGDSSKKQRRLKEEDRRVGRGGTWPENEPKLPRKCRNSSLLPAIYEGVLKPSKSIRYSICRITSLRSVIVLKMVTSRAKVISTRMPSSAFEPTTKRKDPESPIPTPEHFLSQQEPSGRCRAVCVITRYFLLHYFKAVAYPGILFVGGVPRNSVENRGQRERGSGGRQPPQSGVLEASVIWYKKFHFL